MEPPEEEKDDQSPIQAPHPCICTIYQDAYTALRVLQGLLALCALMDIVVDAGLWCWSGVWLGHVVNCVWSGKRFFVWCFTIRHCTGGRGRGRGLAHSSQCSGRIWHIPEHSWIPREPLTREKKQTKTYETPHRLSLGKGGGGGDI